jgi:hypothetical protein
MPSLVRVDPTICFPSIKRFLRALRHAALVKREAFFALANPHASADRNI